MRAGSACPLEREPPSALRSTPLQRREQLRGQRANRSRAERDHCIAWADDLHQRLPGYAETSAAFRRAFERDKDVLREMGIPLVLQQVDPSQPNVDGYRIPKEEYYLKDPGLDPDLSPGAGPDIAPAMVMPEPRITWAVPPNMV